MALISVLGILVLYEEWQRNIRYEPNIMFCHKDAAYQTCDEVSHSQTRKFLVALADNYILGTHGGIGVTAGLDLNYKKSEQATISVWRLDNSTSEEGKVKQAKQSSSLDQWKEFPNVFHLSNCCCASCIVSPDQL